VSISRGIDGARDPGRPEPAARAAGIQEERRTVRSSRLGSGTLACPACDAPVALTEGRVSPSDPLDCPVCAHAASVRDFLSLAMPTRPARVDVHVVLPAR
jgi:hypothetical protein